MKLYPKHYSQIQNNDDTLIERLKWMDDDSTSQRSFGVEIHNRPYEVYSIKKKNPPPFQDLRTNEKVIQQEFRTDGGKLAPIQRDYRINILMNLVNNDLAIKVIKEHHHERNLVVNWLVLIHSKYSFEPETLHEAVRIFDKFISKMEIGIEDYQKYALTAFWMAAKMEERKVKQLKLWLTFGKGYSLSDVIMAEHEILQALEFRLALNTPQRFLFTFATFFSLEPKAFILCNYILELSLLNIHYLKYPASIVALSCLLVCSKVLRKEMCPKTTYEIERMSLLLNLPIKLVYDCSRKLCRTLQGASADPLNSVYRKYSSKSYLKISLIQLGRA